MAKLFNFHIPGNNEQIAVFILNVYFDFSQLFLQTQANEANEDKPYFKYDINSESITL